MIRRLARGFVAGVVAVGLIATAACTDQEAESGSRADAPAATTSIPQLTMPRYVTDADIPLEVSAAKPLFLYNIYVGQDATTIDRVVDLWPDDLVAYLGFQIIFPSNPTMPADERAGALDAFLDRTDEVGIPALVQTAAFTGQTGPNDAEMGGAFADHPSLVGVSIAELSADYATSVGGLSPTQKDLIASTIETAARHRGLFLWADMGYFGPQVFVDAGADARLVDLMRQHHDRIIIQAKQNGAGRRFGTESAAFGLFTSGLADNWGINSEDWLWYEASFEQLFAPQLPGGLTAAGMTRSTQANRARLTFPESLFGTEMVVAAASGASVFSIETPARGTIDVGHGAVSPAGENVVFPLLRRLITSRLIPDRDQVLDDAPLAVRPPDRDPALLATDTVFDDLYGADGCTADDRITCTQRQWLPSTGRFGIIPTIPALSDQQEIDRFDRVVTLDPSVTSASVRTVADTLFPAGEHGNAWSQRSGRAGTWFVANPNENTEVTTTFALDGVAGEIGPHTFAIVTVGDDERRLFIDNYRTDAATLWSSSTPDDQLAGVALAEVPTAEPATTVLRFDSRSPGARATVEGAVSVTQRHSDGVLEVTFTHRGPVTVSVG